MDIILNESVNLTIHSDGKSMIDKWIRDKYNLEPGTKVHVLLQGASYTNIKTSQAPPEVQKLTAAKVSGRLKERVPKMKGL